MQLLPIGRLDFCKLLRFIRLKVCLYRTLTRLGGVREGMVEIKQTKVVYTDRESERRTRLETNAANRVRGRVLYKPTFRRASTPSYIPKVNELDQ